MACKSWPVFYGKLHNCFYFDPSGSILKHMTFAGFTISHYQWWKQRYHNTCPTVFMLDTRVRDTTYRGAALSSIPLHCSALCIRVVTACRFIECTPGWYITPKFYIVSALRLRAGPVIVVLLGGRNARHGVDIVISNEFWLINDTIKLHKLLIMNLQDISKFGKLN